MALNLNPRSIIVEGIGLGAAHVLLLGFVQVSLDASVRQPPARGFLLGNAAQDPARVLFLHSFPHVARGLLLTAGQQSSAFSLLPSVPTQQVPTRTPATVLQIQKRPVSWASPLWQHAARALSGVQAFQAHVLPFSSPLTLPRAPAVGSIPPAQQRAVRGISGQPAAQRPVTGGKARKQ